MNRGYNYTPRGLARSPPRTARLHARDSGRSSSLRHQAPVKQDINIDDFGDMGSDEDDFQTLSRNFVPPKPPAQPQYNLVPHGFLRDDDELIEDDYDGVPIDDSVLGDSPQKQPWERSPCAQEEVRGDPISVLGSNSRRDSHASKWPNTRAQEVGSRNRPGLGSSSVNSEAGRWDKKGAPIKAVSSERSRNIPPLSVIDSGVGKAQSFVRSNDDNSPFLKTGSIPASSNSMRFVRGTEESNPFVKGSTQSVSLSDASFVPTKDISSSSRSHDNTLRWSSDPKPVQSSSPAWAKQDTRLSESLKGQVQPAQKSTFTSTGVSNTSSHLELLQAAALQQALTGLTQLGSQSGLTLLGAQNLLLQASQNPTLAAALVASGGLLNTGLGPIQPNALNNPTVQAVVKSSTTSAVPDVPQSSVGLLTYPLRSNIKGNPGFMPQKKSIPDGSGSTRYPAPDVSSLVFDPSTGYRFDASTGLHYDANSGYFFNGELKIFLRWDKFTQTYLKVDNPPGVPRFIDSSTERISYMKDVPLASHDKGPQSSSFSNTPFLEKSIHSSTSSYAKESHHEYPPVRGVPTSSSQNEINTLHSSMITIPTDFSKPPPSLHQTSYSDSGFQHSLAKPPSAGEQKVANLPNYAETSLFNKLRKAKLAQTAQAKPDRKLWGSPDPLLEAAQKHAAEINKAQEEILNLSEILQRSRQFMKQNTGKPLDASDDITVRQTRKVTSRSRSGDRKPLRRSRSLEKPVNRREKPSTSPQQRRHLARSPDARLHAKEKCPNSRIRRRPSLSPTSNRARGRSSLSPESRRKRSASRGRSPINRARGRVSTSPEARKRKHASRGRSPLRRRPKARESPDTRQGRPFSRGRSPEKRSRGRGSISQEPRNRRLHSCTPEKSLNRSPSRKVKVVLNQSPGGSKVGVRSSFQNNKRSAERGLSAERRTVRRRLSPSIIKSAERIQASAHEETGLAAQRPLRERIRGNRNESPEQGKIIELKSIPYNTPQASGKKPSRKGKDASDYKSLSNLRNQSKEKPREHAKKQVDSQLNKVKSATSRASVEVDLSVGSDNEKRHEKMNKSAASKQSSIEVDLTVDSDSEKRRREKINRSADSKRSTGVNLAVDLEDEKHGRANHRLVSERFSSGWGKKKPIPVSQKSPTKKTDTTIESHLLAMDSVDTADIKDTNKKDKTSEEGELVEESNEFDFLTETLDDDNESTVIDEYEEILDYQDLDETAEFIEKEPHSSQMKPESIESPVIDICIDLYESAIQTTTSESQVECKQISSESELVERPSEKSDGVGDDEAVAQREEKGTKLRGDEDIDDVKPQDVVVVDKILDNTTIAPDAQSLKDRASGIEVKKPDTPAEEMFEKADASESHNVPTQDGTTEVQLKAEKDGMESNEIEKSAIKMKGDVTGKVGGSDSGRHAHEIEPESLDNEKWNVVDSVDDHEESMSTISTDVKEFSHDDKHDSPKLNLGEANALPAKLRTDEVSQKVKDGGSDVAQNSVGISYKDGSKNAISDPEVAKGDEKNEKADTQLCKEDGNTEERPLEGSSIQYDPTKEVISKGEKEESLPQVRSVSDIEKFLLLSSQEVEAKREQGVEPTSSKNEKKSGVFSRLGEKLPSNEARDEPKVILELPPEAPVPSSSPIKSIAATTSKGKTGVAKPSGAASAPKKLQKAGPEDSIGRLFDDKPTSQILIGPMNFIEPLRNFQQFTQKFMQKMLQREGVKFKQVYVCHEDVTGAPYHYILVMFHNAKLASDWYKKHKGKFRCDEKLFSQVAGYTKQKLIPGAETYMYFTGSNWVCKVCKKGNFPPRSLCFGCFQHKDPEGFSPVTILDKGPPSMKMSSFVGTPKLKFFVTKETIIKSAPALDGFDIKNIEMIMDEKMGFPAGICVFEMSNYIDAGKLKKYLNHRDVEAVSVEMHARPDPQPTEIVSPRQTAPNESGEERSCKPSQDRSVSEIDTRDRSVHEGGRRARKLSPGIASREVPVERGRSPSLPRRCSLSPIREVRVPRGRSPTPPRGVRAPRGRSPTPPRDVRVPRGRSRTPPRDFRVLRGRSPTPTRDGRVLRGRSPSPPREVRITRRRSPTPPREVRISRGRSPTPPRGGRVPRGRSSSPSRHVGVSRFGSPSLLRSRLSRDRVRSRSPRLHSPGYRPRSRSPQHVSQGYEDPYTSTGSRSVRDISRGRTVREVSPRYQSRERPTGYRSPVPRRSPGYRSPPRYCSRSPIRDTPRRRSPSPRYRSKSPVRPIKPDGRSEWRYPPPDPTNFRFEPRSGLDYDPTTTLYYEPKSCCFYNDDTNEWLEYEPRTGRYVLVR